MTKKLKELPVTVELRKFKHAVPFKPFCIATTNDTILTIATADFAISPKGDVAIVYVEGEEGHRVLNLRHVLSIEPVGNGTKKPGKR